MKCKRCETVPSLPEKANLIYTFIPTHHHEPLFETCLNDHAMSFKKIHDYYVVETQDLDQYITMLTSIFNPLEQRDIKVMPFNGKSGVLLDDLVHMKSLTEWIHYYQANELRHVLKHNSLEVNFQPIMKGNGVDVFGYEGLIRGIDAAGNIIPPNILFRQARQIDLLFNLDKAAREKVIEVAAKRNIDKHLFINFLPTAIYKPELCLKTTNAAISQYGLKPENITFEVVETERVKDFNHLNDILSFYKKQGYQTALDDVGTGYSNIKTIQKLKPNLIKIDRSIVENIQNSKAKQKLVKKYLDVCNQLNIKVLAEGIETKEEADFFISMNVDYLQGYYFGKPAKEFLSIN